MTRASAGLADMNVIAAAAIALPASNPRRMGGDVSPRRLTTRCENASAHWRLATSVVDRSAIAAAAAMMFMSVEPAKARVIGGNRLPSWAAQALVGATPRQRFRAALALAATRQGLVELSVVDIVSGRRYDSGTSTIPVRTASIIKVPIAMALMAKAEQQGRGLTANESSDLTLMIRSSDGDAATRLWDDAGGANVIGLIRNLGGSHTAGPANGSSWGFTTTTSSDMASVLSALASGRILTAGNRARILDEMRNVVPSQRWGIAQAVAHSEPAVKNGWYPDTDESAWRVNCLGIVARGGAPTRYSVSVMTQYPIGLGQSYGEETCRLVAATVLPRLI